MPSSPFVSTQADEPRLVWRQPGLWLALAAGLILKLALITSGSIGFNSDEAVMSLMARHILHGELATFYWGQDYMGALDSYFIAGFFALFGQSILTARLAALTLFLVAIGTTYLLAYRISEDEFAASAAALLLALPPVMLALYTSVSLGAFIEILVLDNLLFLIGWVILSERRDGAGWWALAGILGGVGWWELPIIAVSLVPLVIVGVRRFWGRIPWSKMGLAAAAFLVGTSPWIYRLAVHPSQVAGDLLGARLGAAVGGDPWTTGLPGRAISVLLFNLPALIGLRPSWTAEWVLWPIGIAVATFYVYVMWQAFTRLRTRRETSYREIALASLLLAWPVIIIPLVLSPFGSDPTGRYVMVLYPPLVILAGDGLGRLRRGIATGFSHSTGRWLAPVIVVGLLAYNVYGAIKYAIQTPPGLSTQLMEETRIPHDYDAALVRFLDEIGVKAAYTNYWIAYRTMFLAGEEIVLSPRLSYRPNLDYTTRDDRYLAYSETVRRTGDVAYITANLPSLDAAIRQGFDGLGVAFREQQIGPYTVFYDLSRHVDPAEMDIYGEVTGNEIYQR